MTPYLTNPRAWQESWDRQQEAYLPDREQRLAAVLDVVDAVPPGPSPRARPGRGYRFDQPAGTGAVPGGRGDAAGPRSGTAGDRLGLARRPRERRHRRPQPSGVDVRAAVHRFDAILTATALHWLTPDRLGTLYGEAAHAATGRRARQRRPHARRRVAGLTERLVARAEAKRDARYAAGAVLSWRDWWDRLAGTRCSGRCWRSANRVPGRSSRRVAATGLLAPGSVAEAGFTEVGTVWRGGADAAVAAVR